MPEERFPAVVATGEGPARMTTLSEDDLPDGDVTVDVAYSSLNYKDGLAVTGRGRIVRRFPLVCGVDLAGTVRSSDSPRWHAGDEVLVTGWGLSETHPGGYTTRERVRSEWVLPVPPGLDPARSMALGTAGLTAMLCVLALEGAGLRPDPSAEVLVTGAAGGVGALSVALLSALGHRVVASTGRTSLEPWLRGLGASRVADRSELADAPARALGSERFAAAVDTVGGTTLAAVLSQVRYRGAVAACGLAGGSELSTTVFPFILRNVSLLGVDSDRCPNELRSVAWGRLASDLPRHVLDSVTAVRPMGAVHELAEEILSGSVRGRVVVDPRA